MMKEKKHSPPLEVFPSVLKLLIEELEEKLGYPVDYTSACFLVAFGAAIGNTTHIKFKNSFIETAALYCVLVGKPARGKTAPLHYCLKHVLEWNKNLYRKYLDAEKAYKAYLLLLVLD